MDLKICVEDSGKFREGNFWYSCWSSWQNSLYFL